MDITGLILKGDQLDKAIDEAFDKKEAILVIATYSTKPSDNSSANKSLGETTVLQLLDIDQVVDWKQPQHGPAVTN